MTIYGYARVSTDGQSFDGQVAELKAAGCAKIYSEKASGAYFDRRELSRMLRGLRDGDSVMVTRLDRLARSTRDLLNIVDAIGKAGASFRSLADSWADTASAHGRLLMTILAGLAEFEREIIRARTDEGRRRAMAAGVKFGPKPKLSRYQKLEALERRQSGESCVSIGRSMNVSHSTISRLS